MNKTAATVSAALVALGGLVALAPPAQAARALAVTTETRAVLLSASHVEVRGSVTCVGSPEEGAVGVVLVQPPGSVAQDGGGSTPFSCEAGETVRWAVLVTAGEGAQFSTAEARFSTYANTPCSDAETDCPARTTTAPSPSPPRPGATGSTSSRRACGSAASPSAPSPSGPSRSPTPVRAPLTCRSRAGSCPTTSRPASPSRRARSPAWGSTCCCPASPALTRSASSPTRSSSSPSALMSVSARDLSGRLVEDARVRLSGRGY